MVIIGPSKAPTKRAGKKPAKKTAAKGRMNKSKLIDALVEMGTDRRQATAAVENLLDTIVRAVQRGESVTITGFGVFEQRRRAARVARNPRTGETVRVKPTSVPAFRPGAQFKAVVSGAERLPAEGPAVKRGSRAGTARKTVKKAAGKKAVKRTAVKKAVKKAAAKSTVQKAAAKKTVKTTAAKKAVKRTAAKKAVKKASVRNSSGRKAPARRGRR